MTHQWRACDANARQSVQQPIQAVASDLVVNSARSFGISSPVSSTKLPSAAPSFATRSGRDTCNRYIDESHEHAGSFKHKRREAKGAFERRVLSLDGCRIALPRHFRPGGILRFHAIHRNQHTALETGPMHLNCYGHTLLLLGCYPSVLLWLLERKHGTG